MQVRLAEPKPATPIKFQKAVDVHEMASLSAWLPDQAALYYFLLRFNLLSSNLHS